MTSRQDDFGSYREASLLGVARTDELLRIEVTDSGRGFQRDDVTQRRDAGGHGLHIIERLSSRWNVECGPPTTVWVELKLA